MFRSTPLNESRVFGLLPPIIAPLASIRLPFKSTSLTPPISRRASSRPSTTMVSPNTYQKAGLYFSLNFTKSIANPCDFGSLIASSAFPRGLPAIILFKGRNVARPSFSFCKYLIAWDATSSSSTTIDCIRAPAAISIAISYFLSTCASSAMVPWIPFRVPSSLAFNIWLTAWLYWLCTDCRASYSACSFDCSR